MISPQTKVAVHIVNLPFLLFFLNFLFFPIFFFLQLYFFLTTVHTTHLGFLVKVFWLSRYLHHNSSHSKFPF